MLATARPSCSNYAHFFAVIFISAFVDPQQFVDIFTSSARSQKICISQFQPNMLQILYQISNSNLQNIIS